MADYDQFKRQFRLPKFAVPKRYEIKLNPNLVTCKFSGAVSVTVDVVSPTKFLVLNAADLDVDSHSLYFTSASQELRAVSAGVIEEDEILVVEFPTELPIGIGVFSVSFVGTLNDRLIGFYRSVYEINGEKANMAVTQFEAAHARRCFPCWDEPAAKATFKITLDVPYELIGLSNMPVLKEKRQGDVKTVHFEESPIMSTYLVAIVVGFFDYAECQTSDGIKVRCYCQVGKVDQVKFALDVAVKSLELYTKYFDEPYPLPKLDMIAVPDFASGAMENFGLVIYRDSCLLYDEQHSAATDKRGVTITVAHELAHQWFGNLVTMEWWTHLWLNEGFATWVSYLGTDIFFPEWKIWTHFVDLSANGLRLDALSESHPIEVEINHTKEVDEVCDAICYYKGASVNRMLQSYLGAERFQRALASYIKRYAFSNAKTEDLWAVLEEESGEPVKDLMQTWTKHKGYPMISVKLNGQRLEIEQSHFLLSGRTEDTLWIVPISLCSGSYDARQTFLLRSKFGEVDVKENSWIKLNVDQTGFYRVNYDDNLAAKLRSAIESNLLSATDRLGILDDSHVLCMGGHLPLTSLLNLISSFREELDYIVLSKLISISYAVVRIVTDAAPEIVGSVKQFFTSLFHFPAGKLGWDPKPTESDLDAMSRGELLIALAKLGHEPTLNEAIRRFDAFLVDRSSSLLPPNIREAAYVALMQKVRASDKSGYEALLRLYRETNLSQEKQRILGSLASCPDPNINLDVLNFLLSSEVRSQDATFGLRISIEGRQTLWKWFEKNWDHISTVWTSGYILGRFVTASVSQFSSNEMAKEVEEFFASRTNSSIARTVKQCIERVQINARWAQSIRKEVHLAALVQELSSSIISLRFAGDMNFGENTTVLGPKSPDFTPEVARLQHQKGGN